MPLTLAFTVPITIWPEEEIITEVPVTLVPDWKYSFINDAVAPEEFDLRAPFQMP